MTTYTLDQKTPYGGSIATLVANSDATLDNVSVSHEYMGSSYSPVSRRIYFSACVIIDDGVGDNYSTKVNHTGFTLWAADWGTVVPLDSYDARFLKNFYLCHLDIDTSSVTMIDVWDSTSAIPNGIHGSDGTWRRMFQASTGLFPTQQFKIIDPLTAGNEKVWVHTTGPECQIYSLLESEGFKHRLSPLTVAGSGHMELLGLTPDWCLVMSSTTTARVDGALYTVPRVTTADEVTADELLGYFFVAEPAWMDTAYWRSVVGQDGKLYIFGAARSGTKDYRLYRYDPPASVGSWTGSSQAGGSFTDITQWAAGTGPNTGVSSYTHDTKTGGVGANDDKIQRWSLNSAWKLPATGKLVLLSQLTPQNTTNAGTDHDPALYRLDCTYADPAAPSFDYHQGFVIGFMKADWTAASGVSDAAYAVQFYREIDSYREFSDFDYGDDYTVRWLAFTVQPVVAGAFTWDATGASDSTVFARYHFVSGAPPVLQRFEVDASWLSTHTAYAGRIANNNVVEQSIQGENEFNPLGEYYQLESGFVDNAGSDVALWFGGQNAQTQDIQTTFPTYTGQDGPTPASAFVRLSFIGDVPPPSHSRRAMVWSNIGEPQLRKKPRLPSPPPAPSAPTVTLSLPNLTGSVNSASPSSAGAGPVVATATGGQSPITWGWQVNSGTFGLSSSSNQASVAQVLAAGGLSAGSIRATATDGLGHTGSADINVYLANTYTPSPPPPPVTPPLIAPSVAWTGTAGSGGSAPTDPPRTTAKPALQTYAPSRQRLTANEVFVFDADALGGVASVEVWLEGTTLTVLRSIYTDTDVNGVARERDGYAVTVDAVAAVARHSTGAAMNMYATATANDGTMQKRVIGPIVILPRSTPIVWSKTIKPGGGGDFTSLAAARAQFVIDRPESAELIFGETNTYDLPAWDGTSYEQHTGFCVFRAAPGVTATLTRARTFTSIPTGAVTDLDYAWTWCPFTGAIEFRGDGIVIDATYWSLLLSRYNGVEFGRHWLNGCQVISTLGRDTQPWNKQPAPGLNCLATSFDTLSPYITDVTVNETQVDSFASPVISGLRSQKGGSNHDMCHFIVGGYETDIDVTHYVTPRTAFTLEYTGAGTGTMVLDPNTLTLDCKVNGVSVGGSFPLAFTKYQLGFGQPASNTYYQISAIVSAINGIGSGSWVAVTGDTTWAGVSLFSEGVQTYTLTSSPQNVISRFYPHTEWWHAIVPIENVIIRDNIVRRSYFSTSPINPGGGWIKDAVFKGNVWDCSAQSGGNIGLQGLHLVATNNYHDSPLVLGPAANWDAYGLVAQNVSNGLAQSGGWSALPITKDNATVGALPTGVGNTGNFAVADLAAASITSKSTGDFRPAGTLLTNLKPRIDIYDGRTNLRAVSDAAGSWAVGYGPPSYPF